MMEEMEEARKKKAAVAEAAKREEQRVSVAGRDSELAEKNIFTSVVLPALIHTFYNGKNVRTRLGNVWVFS